MTESEKREHDYRYNERLGIMGVWGVPSQFEHNTAVQEANLAIAELRKQKGNDMVSKLKQLRESL